MRRGKVVARNIPPILRHHIFNDYDAPMSIGKCLVNSRPTLSSPKLRGWSIGCCVFMCGGNHLSADESKAELFRASSDAGGFI